MNERIKELAEQAGFMLWGDESWNPGDIVDWSARYDDELAKFAELLIRECEKVAKDGPWYYDSPSCGWRNPINFVCNEMKEHFGVEE